MVKATYSDGNSSDTTDQGGEMERNYKDDGSTTRINRLDIKRSGLYEIQDHTSRSTTNYEYKYPHEKLPTDGLYHKKNIVICNMCKIDD